MDGNCKYCKAPNSKDNICNRCHLEEYRYKKIQARKPKEQHNPCHHCGDSIKHTIKNDWEGRKYHKKCYIAMISQ